MRISTGTIYDLGVSSMQQQTQALIKTQQQIAAGRRILTPSDDPIAAARVLEVSQSQAINTQYITNSGTANDALALQEATLGSIYGLLQDVRDASVAAGNGGYNASDRATLATDLSGRYQELLGLANSTDAAGQYLFSGYQGGVRPFKETEPGKVAYNGDQGQRLIQVSASRQMAVSESGADVLQRALNGNGTFATQAGAANTGQGVIDSGTVLDTAKWDAGVNAAGFSIRFAADPVLGLTYDIVDESNNTSLLTGLAAGTLPYARVYDAGGLIPLKSQGAEPAFDLGVETIIKGAPNDGDSFSLKPSVPKDVFETISELINLLKTAPAGAELSNGLVSAQQNLDNAMLNVSTLRASTGGRMKELDSIINAGEDRSLQYSQTMSRLQDLDYAQAASDLTMQQVNLEAAQKSFVKVAGLSLFDYI